MIQLLTNNNSNLINKNRVKCNVINNNLNWFESKKISDQSELSKQYATICQQHRQQKKWVLFINPDESSLDELANTHGVDISKVLCVNVKNKHNGSKQEAGSISLNIEQIKSVLCRGNCSAVILSNALFKQAEIVQLNNCAKKGETQCLLLKTIEPKEKIKLH